MRADRSQPQQYMGPDTGMRLNMLKEVSEETHATPNQEVVSLHWLPLERLLAPECRSTMEYRYGQATLQLPCLRVDELVIWGLTYRMFDNFRELVEAASSEGP